MAKTIELTNIGEPFILDLPVVDYTGIKDPDLYFVNVKIRENLKQITEDTTEEPFTLLINNKEYKDPVISLLIETSRYAGLNFLSVEVKDDSNKKYFSFNLEVSFTKFETEVDPESYIEACGLPFTVKSDAFITGNTVKYSDLSSYKDTYNVSYNSYETDNIVSTELYNTVKRNRLERQLKSSDLHEDLSSGLLVRTNPSLTGNIKLNVTEDGNAYFDTFKVSNVLSKRQYRKQKIDLTNSYSYDIRKIYKSLPKYDFYEPEISNFNLDEIDIDKYHFVDSTYSYGCSTNDDPLYTENYSLLAPLYLNHKLPDYFCVFRVETESTDITDIIKNSKLVTYYSFSEKTNIGKYLHKHLDAIQNIESPIFVQLTNNEEFKNINENSITGISVDTGVISTIKETTYKQDNILDQDRYFEHYNTYLSDVYSRNNLIAYNIINLCYMFDDPNVEPFSSNRYIGLYLSENEFIKITGTSFHDNNIFHKNGDKEVHTDLITDPYTSIFNKANVSDLLIFALSDNGVKRITKQEDYNTFLKNKILNTPGELLLSTKGVKLLDNFKYKEFINIDLAESLNAGNHLRFIFPQVTTTIVSEDNIQRSLKSEILKPITKLTRPVIFDIIGCNDTELYNIGYTQIPSITEDKGMSLYPYQLYMGKKPGDKEDPNDPGSGVLDWLFGNRIFYMPKNDQDLKKDENLNTKELKDKYIAYYQSLFKSNNGKKTFSINFSKRGDAYSNEATKFLTEHLIRSREYVRGIRGSFESNFVNGVLKPGKTGFVVTNDSKINELVLKSDNFEFVYHTTAKIIHSGFLVDSESNQIKTNIDYAFTDKIDYASPEYQTDRIIDAIKAAIKASQLDVTVIKSGPTSITLASNYSDCVFQQVYPQDSLEHLDDSLNINSIVINGRPDIKKELGQTTDIKGSIFNKYKWSYLLNNSIFSVLGKRTFSAFSFIKNDGSFIEYEKPDDLIISHSLLYRRFNYDSLKFDYKNIDPIYFKQINLNLIKYTNRDLLNLLHNVPDLDDQNDSLSEEYDRKFDFLSMQNYTIYDIASPLNSDKRVIKAKDATLLSNKINLYQSYAHSVSLMGINNILDFNFNINDPNWIVTKNKDLSLLTPTRHTNVFNIGSIEASTQKRNKINEKSVKDLIKPNVISNKTINVFTGDKLFNKKIQELNSSVFQTLKDKTTLANLINEAIKNKNCLYTTGRYNVKNRIFKFTLLDLNIELKDISLDGFLLSNYDFYKVQYVPIKINQGKSKIYFVFDSTLKTLTVLQTMGSDYVVDGKIDRYSAKLNQVFLKYSYAKDNDLNINDTLRAKYGQAGSFRTPFKPFIFEKAEKDGPTIISQYTHYYIGSGRNNGDLITSITRRTPEGQYSYLNIPIFAVINEFKHNVTSNINKGYLEKTDIHVDFRSDVEQNDFKDSLVSYSHVNDVQDEGFTTENIQKRFISDDKEYIFKNDSGVDIKNTFEIYVEPVSIYKGGDFSNNQVIQVPVTYQFNILSKNNELSSTLEDYFNINGYSKNLYLTSLSDISEYNKKIYNSYSANNNGYLNAFKTTKSLTDLYHYYRLYGDNDFYSSIKVNTLDIKSYFNSRAISLRGSKNGIITIDNWDDSNAYSFTADKDKAAIKINLNQLFLDEATNRILEKLKHAEFKTFSLKNSDIKDFIINKLVKYYKFDTSNIVTTLYKSNTDINNENKLRPSLSKSDRELNFSVVKNITSHITIENNITFYILEIPTTDKRQYFLELSFLPTIDQGKTKHRAN